MCVCELIPLIVMLVFQVYIIRAKNSRELDGALSLLNLDSYPKQKVGGKTCFSMLFISNIVSIMSHAGFMHSWYSILTFFVFLLNVLREG